MEVKCSENCLLGVFDIKFLDNYYLIFSDFICGLIFSCDYVINILHMNVKFKWIDVLILLGRRPLIINESQCARKLIFWMQLFQCYTFLSL